MLHGSKIIAYHPSALRLRPRHYPRTRGVSRSYVGLDPQNSPDRGHSPRQGTFSVWRLSVSRRRVEREFFIDNSLVRIHSIIEMIQWTGLAPWDFEFPSPGSLTSTFQEGVKPPRAAPSLGGLLGSWKLAQRPNSYGGVVAA